MNKKHELIERINRVSGFVTGAMTVIMFCYAIFDKELSSIGAWIKENRTLLFIIIGIGFITFILTLTAKYSSKPKTSDKDKTDETPIVCDDLQLYEPIKYISGTGMPYPRDQKPDEDDMAYEKYLTWHYAQYGIKRNKIKIPREPWPHERTTDKDGNLIFTDYYNKFAGIKPPEVISSTVADVKSKYENGLFTKYGFANFNGFNYCTLNDEKDKRQFIINYIAYLLEQAEKDRSLYDFVQGIVNTNKDSLVVEIENLDELIENKAVVAYSERIKK